MKTLYIFFAALACLIGSGTVGYVLNQTEANIGDAAYIQTITGKLSANQTYNLLAEFVLTAWSGDPRDTKLIWAVQGQNESGEEGFNYKICGWKSGDIDTAFAQAEAADLDQNLTVMIESKDNGIVTWETCSKGWLSRSIVLVAIMDFANSIYGDAERVLEFTVAPANTEGEDMFGYRIKGLESAAPAVALTKLMDASTDQTREVQIVGKIVSTEEVEK
jgi:hypothetical protein